MGGGRRKEVEFPTSSILLWPLDKWIFHSRSYYTKSRLGWACAHPYRGHTGSHAGKNDWVLGFAGVWSYLVVWGYLINVLH